MSKSVLSLCALMLSLFLGCTGSRYTQGYGGIYQHDYIYSNSHYGGHPIDHRDIYIDRYGVARDRRNHREVQRLERENRELHREQQRQKERLEHQQRELERQRFAHEQQRKQLEEQMRREQEQRKHKVNKRREKEVSPHPGKKHSDEASRREPRREAEHKRANKTGGNRQTH